MVVSVALLSRGEHSLGGFGVFIHARVTGLGPFYILTIARQ